MSDHYKTSHTLIQRALDLNDESAWEKLHAHYSRFIFYVLQEMGVSPEEVQDISQQTLINLMKNLKSYDREKAKFRTWLRSVVRNAALNHLSKESNQQKTQSNYIADCKIENVTSVEELDEWIEGEWENYILTTALDRIRPLYKGAAVEVFELSLAGKSTSEIMEFTGYTENSVYTLKKRVKKSLIFEVRALEENLQL